MQVHLISVCVCVCVLGENKIYFIADNAIVTGLK